jgi:hypothetical protein
MDVVRKAGAVSSVIKKTPVRSLSISSTRSPSQIEEMGDTNFGTLDATKDGYVVSYDSTTDKFILVTADQLLTTAAEDSDIDNTFIDAVESELDLGAVAVSSVDGGTF